MALPGRHIGFRGFPERIVCKQFLVRGDVSSRYQPEGILHPYVRVTAMVDLEREVVIVNFDTIHPHIPLHDRFADALCFLCSYFVGVGRPAPDEHCFARPYRL